MSRVLKGVFSIVLVPIDSFDFPRLSKTIGFYAFAHCESLEALFLPSTVKSIEFAALIHCPSLRLLILPHDMNLKKVGKGIIWNTVISYIARDAGVARLVWYTLGRVLMVILLMRVIVKSTNGCFIVWTRRHSTNFIITLLLHQNKSLTSVPHCK